MSYASGKNSYALCDNCGFRYPYLEIRATSYNTRVCSTCYDGAFDLKNHPQNSPPPVVPDPIALRYARPDEGFAEAAESARSRHAFGPFFARRQ